MKAVVLTYHSHRVQGPGYAQNDHAALPVDLQTIAGAGCRIVSLATLVAAIEAHRSGAAAGVDEATLVAQVSGCARPPGVARKSRIAFAKPR